MDLYCSTFDTVAAYVQPGSDQLWSALRGSQTLFWYKTDAPTRAIGASSVAEKITFFIADLPAHAGLERLRSFKSWSDNWDAEGSKAPDPAVIDAASKVFGLLAVHQVPQVTLSAEGHPMLIFSDPVAGEVVVTRTNSIDYFFREDGAPEREDVTFDGHRLPADLLEYLQISPN